MSAITYLVGTVTLFLVGFYSGMAQGEKNGRIIGFNEGVKSTLAEVDKFMKGGLKSPLDWETAHKLLQQKISKN